MNINFLDLKSFILYDVFVFLFVACLQHFYFVEEYSQFAFHKKRG